MAPEKRLADIDALLEEIDRTIDIMEKRREHFSLRNLIMCIKNAPTVDAVEVVRCKDCKKWLKVEPSGTNCRYCAITTRSRLPYDFCSYGERRSGE